MVMTAGTSSIEKMIDVVEKSTTPLLSSYWSIAVTCGRGEIHIFECVMKLK